MMFVASEDPIILDIHDKSTSQGWAVVIIGGHTCVKIVGSIDITTECRGVN